MAKTLYKLMSASGNSFCEVSIAHNNRVALAWVKIDYRDAKYLACGECADTVQEQGVGTILRDLRNAQGLAECGTCGHAYRLDEAHTHEGDSPYPVMVDDSEYINKLSSGRIVD